MAETPIYNPQEIHRNIQQPFRELYLYLLPSENALHASMAMGTVLHRGGFGETNTDAMRAFSTFLEDYIAEAGKQPEKIRPQLLSVFEQGQKEPNVIQFIHRVITTTMALGFMVKFHNRNEAGEETTDPKESWVQSGQPRENLSIEGRSGRINAKFGSDPINVEAVTQQIQDFRESSLTRPIRSILLNQLQHVAAQLNESLDAPISEDELQGLREYVLVVAGIIYAQLVGWDKSEGAYPLAKLGPKAPAPGRAAAVPPTEPQQQPDETSRPGELVGGPRTRR